MCRLVVRDTDVALQVRSSFLMGVLSSVISHQSILSREIDKRDSLDQLLLGLVFQLLGLLNLPVGFPFLFQALLLSFTCLVRRLSYRSALHRTDGNRLALVASFKFFASCFSSLAISFS